MGKKRKRPIKDGQSKRNVPQPCSQSKRTTNIPGQPAGEHSHPVISIYYRQLVSLRQYLLQQIPVCSKSRRRKIMSVPIYDTSSTGYSDDQANGLSKLLDTTLVGILKETPPTRNPEILQGFAEFTGSQDRSLLISTDTGPPCPQAEIVDFVILTLFKRTGFSYQKPLHVLTHGYQRARGTPSTTRNKMLACSIPGVVAQFSNKNVQLLKQAPWTDVLGLLGNNGEEIMFTLLLDCGVFTSIDHWKGIYYQTSGIPLSVLGPVGNATSQHDPKLETICIAKDDSRRQGTGRNLQLKPGTIESSATVPKPNNIAFFRRRMLYARPALDLKGEIQFGLTSRHVLNRFPSASLPDTVHVMKYIFPRQFALHNVFTCTPDPRTSTLPVNDYSSREEEIARSKEQKGSTKVPKRLRGKAVELVRQLQTRNKRCSYGELMRYYCPSQCIGPSRFGPLDTQSSSTNSEPKSSGSEPLITQLRLHHQQSSPEALPPPSHPVDTFKDPEAKPNVLRPKLSLTDYATPTSSVSAFCRAVLRKLVPPQFYGVGEHGTTNKNVVFRHIDRFVRMRRFESLTIHEVCKGIKVTCIPWLEPPTVHSQGPNRNKLSLSDTQKRIEILHELLYYIFDSLLIPLIRANFYVTESQTHRNRLFYFRHDIWRQLTEQPLSDLKLSTFEELKPSKAERMLSRRSLPYGSLRLLPKTTGIRPILNLRRRMLVKSKWTGRTSHFLGSSINSTITPIYGMLNYERTRRQNELGSCMFSTGEIHSRLKRFKERLLLDRQKDSMPTFYFVKLDIQSCFDTIPQDKLVRLVEGLVSEDAYYFTRHVELRPPDEFGDMWPMPESKKNKAFRKFVGRSAPVTKPQHLTEAFESGGVSRRRNTVFVDAIGQKEHETEDLLDLLDEHVRNNLVKFGRKYFRQRNGIPQGSVLSSLLCNLFYAEMEREVLGFLSSNEALLLRLVDDFLLITTNLDVAKRFLQVMIRGQPAYGISVNPVKSLVNFSAAVEGTYIPRLVDTFLFPYCGSLINTHTLEIHKDHDRALEGGETAALTLSNSLTVESARAPGRTLHRKLLGSFKLLMHPMYLDTNHNSVAVVLFNLYANFLTTAMKMYQYMRSLQGRAHPGAEVIIRIIRDITQLSQQLIRSKRDGDQGEELTGKPCAPSLCSVQHAQAQYLAAAAFRFVLGRKQTRYTTVLRWLDLALKGSRPKSAAKATRLGQVIRKGNLMYGSWRF